MAFAINAEGVQAIEQCKSSLEESRETMNSQTTMLGTSLDANKSALGPHVADIEQIIEDMRTQLGQAISPVINLEEKLSQLSSAYKAIIDKKLSVS